MSKSSKKAGRRVKRQSDKKVEILSDVTINDFANASVLTSGSRLKKNSANKTAINVKQMSSQEDDRAWDEKLDELELVIPQDDDEEEDKAESKKPSVRRRRNTSTTEYDKLTDRTGNDYPIDIWFLISEYIHPESVGTFSLICKTSHAVVQTAKFWFDLYKRYYRSVPNLPERLQPECIVRKYGLKTSVIRALYFMYPPYINRLKPQTTFEGDPHMLIKRQCVLSWSQKVKNQWLFFFKLKLCDGHSGLGRRVTSTKPDLLEMLEDISVNVDDSCKVLQVACLNFSPLPMIVGQKLCNVSLTLSQGLRHHRLQLNFGCGPVSYMTNSTVILDPVINVRVMDWWHPSFPHTDGLQSNSFSNYVATSFEDLDL